MFYPTTGYQIIEELEAAFPAIRAELLSLQAGNFMEWPEKYLYGEGWSVFGFYARGTRLAENCALCPTVGAIADRYASGLFQAGFSRMKAGTHIQPHVGAPKTQLRCHLALVVPPGDACLRVGTETRQWTEGKCLLFDDTIEHEAWNRTEGERVVLLIDIERLPA